MKTIAQLKMEVQNEPTKDDLIEAIIFRSGKNILPKSQDILQKSFCNLKKKEPELFSTFIFDESGIAPFSDELDSVLFRLEASTILSTLNPTYKSYSITSLSLLEKSYKKFKDNKKAKIDECALTFAQYIDQIIAENNDGRKNTKKTA
jgi:hypothetical protein